MKNNSHAQEKLMLPLLSLILEGIFKNAFLFLPLNKQDSLIPTFKISQLRLRKKFACLRLYSL